MIVSADNSENELLVYEFMNAFINTLHQYFGKFTEKHVLFNPDKMHLVLNEMVVKGNVVEVSPNNILGPIILLQKQS